MLSRFIYILARCAGRIASLLSRILGKGSGEQIQGRVIDMISRNALRFAAAHKRIVIISATNGKTTTTRLIASALAQKYPDVISNALGANQRAGVIAALVNGSTKNKNQWAVLEVDERSLPGLFDELHPELLVLGNLSRDQLDRFGEVASISQSWKKMLQGTHTHVVANACDPHIVFATSDLDKNIVEYVDLFSQWHSDAHTCPACGALLEWDDESHFDCPSCDFTIPRRLSIVPKIREQIANSLAIPGEWNVSNAILAYVTVKKLGIDDDSIFSAWPTITDVAGRNAVFELGNRTIQLFLAKNPAGWNETLKHISSPDNTTIFAFNCNIADGKDPSWLYDVDFESLRADDIIVFGERATDMIVRLDVAGKNTQRADNILDALALTPENARINLVASYTQFLSLSRELPKRAESTERAVVTR